MLAGVNMRVEIRNPVVGQMDMSPRGGKFLCIYIYKWLQRQPLERPRRLRIIASADDRYSDVCFVFSDWRLPRCNSEKVV